MFFVGRLSLSQKEGFNLKKLIALFLQDAIDKMVANARGAALCEVMTATFLKFSNKGVVTQRPGNG